MQQLCKLKPKGIRKTIGKVEFVQNKDLNSGMNSPGVLQTFEQWTLEKTIASGQFNRGRGIIFDANNDIVVTTTSSGYHTMLYDENGTYKRQITASNQGGSDYQGRSHPWGNSNLTRWILLSDRQQSVRESL